MYKLHLWSIIKYYNITPRMKNARASEFFPPASAGNDRLEQAESDGEGARSRRPSRYLFLLKTSAAREQTTARRRFGIVWLKALSFAGRFQRSGSPPMRFSPHAVLTALKTTSSLIHQKWIRTWGAPAESSDESNFHKPLSRKLQKNSTQQSVIITYSNRNGF